MLPNYIKRKNLFINSSKHIVSIYFLLDIISYLNSQTKLFNYDLVKLSLIVAIIIYNDSQAFPNVLNGPVLHGHTICCDNISAIRMS